MSALDHNHNITTAPAVATTAATATAVTETAEAARTLVEPC